MPRKQRLRIYIPTGWQRLLEYLRGQDILVVDAGDVLPMLVVRFPRSRKGREAAASLSTAYRQLLNVIDPSPLNAYAEILPMLPRSVVVQFRDFHPGGCLGHARPLGLESDFAKSLARESGTSVGEVDLAWELIAQWQPRPLSTLAVPEAILETGDLRFRVGLLTILFHEMEHLAFPEREERLVRQRSDAFWDAVLRSSAREHGGIFGLAVSPEEST